MTKADVESDSPGSRGREPALAAFEPALRGRACQLAQGVGGDPVRGPRGRARVTGLMCAPDYPVGLLLRAIGREGQVALWAGLRCDAGEAWRELSAQVFPEFTFPVPPAS